MANGAYLIPSEWIKKYNQDKKENVTITEAAEMAGVSRSMIHSMLKAGKMKGIQVKRGSRAAWKIPVDEVEKYKERRLTQQ